jgi:hypothetical protein
MMNAAVELRCPPVSPGSPAISVVLSHRIRALDSETIGTEKRS